MKLFELIREDISSKSTESHIVDILTTQMPQLYRKLISMAEKMFYNKGNLDGFPFIVGGQKKRWYEDFYFIHMKSALYAYARRLPQAQRKKLTDFLGNKDSNFKGIENILVFLLEEIGAETNNKRMEAAAKTAIKAQSEFAEVVAGFIDQETKDVPEVQPKANKKKKDSVKGQQNAQVEQVINDVLSRLNKKVAGDIRNKIAKSSNKLQDLQSELIKRGIKV